MSESPQLFALARVAGEVKGEGPRYCCGAVPLTRRPNGRRPLPLGEAQIGSVEAARFVGILQGSPRGAFAAVELRRAAGKSFVQ